LTTTTIGISGPSCAGKTVLATALQNRLAPAVILQQDWYFVDPDTCPPDANFCDARYLDWDSFLRALAVLRSGHPVEVPQVDFSSFKHIGARRLEPAPVLIVEGMTIFRAEEVLSCVDLAYYLAPEPETLQQRKRDRDARERGKSRAVVEAQLRWMMDEFERDLLDLPAVVVLLRGSAVGDETIRRVLRDLADRNETASAGPGR
jgi:uridine kinase